jgi:hypothetical protein
MSWPQWDPNASAVQQRLHREQAERVPWLLDAGLADAHWQDKGDWTLLGVSSHRNPFTPVELLSFARRHHRILVTTDARFLDDERFPPASCAGLVIVPEERHVPLDEYLTTLVGLLGPFVVLYEGVKASFARSGELLITAPAGRSRRVTRRFQLDQFGLPLLAEIQSTDGAIAAFPGYRRSAARGTPLQTGSAGASSREWTPLSAQRPMHPGRTP